MGLLRKAVGASTSSPSSTSQKSRPSREKRESGLLRKSLRILESAAQLPSLTAAPALSRSAASQAASAALVPALQPGAAALEEAEGPRADETAQAIFNEISLLSDGVELPSRLFTALKKHLAIVKGALLLYDASRLEYAPWASCGYDQTTLHRLRIALGANETFNALANGKPLSVTDPAQKAQFKSFFSSREYSLAERILLVPFIFEETLAGVLLVTELKAGPAAEDELLECLEQVSLAASPLVQNARGRLLKAAAPAARRPTETPEEQISKLLSSPASRGKKFLFASVSLATYTEKVIASHEDLDTFRLGEDVRYFLDAFFADVGMAIPLAPSVYLVCLEEFPRESLDLLTHQLGLFLGTMFQAPTEAGTPAGISVTKSRSWPDEGSDVRELVAFLSS